MDKPEELEHPAVVFMPEISKTHMGGTMIGCTKSHLFVVDDRKVKRLYGGLDAVSERHRHRYEVNPDLIDRIEDAGLIYVGKDDGVGQRCEIMELTDHPYYVGTHHHPEFKSSPRKAQPPILRLA